MLCPACHSANPPEARFCLNCGHRLAEQPAPRPAEGERKLVTVLFADVVGSTSMGERLDPEQVTEVMNGAFAFMNAAVARYGGTVSRLMGDAVLALFGAPAAHEDDPERAVQAALEMQREARDYAGRVRLAYGVDFHVRVGIHTGLAVLDQVGDAIRAEYTAMGDTPNVAARLQSAAAPGAALVSADTYRLTRHAFDFEPRGALEMKGKAAPVEAWQVLGVKEARQSARGLEGLHAPLVGRAAEFGRLQARLRALRETGAGALVAVLGEAGLGKSRLAAEARAWAEVAFGPALTWLEGRSISYGQSISYYPWRQIVRQSIGAHESDRPEAVREKLEYAVCECCKLPGGDQPFLEAMLAVAGEESLQTVKGYSGDALVAHMTDAVRGYLCAWARVAPQVILFEDLHWADQASLDLLRDLADLVREHPLLIVCLTRPERGAPLGDLLAEIGPRLGPDYYEEIALAPLPETDSRELLAHLLHIEDLPEDVRALILARSEGNPFFVEEVIRSLLDSGLVVQQNGHWRATSEIVSVSIPNTLAGLLAARIDALPDPAKRLAQMAAVLGRAFAFRILETVCAAAPAPERIHPLEPHVDTLLAEEILRLRARAPELEYAFKHALTQEAAYNSLLIRRRKEFHARAGLALESLHPDQLDELAPTLAHHFWQAEDWARAADYAVRAGRAAEAVYAMRDAINHYGRAVEALDKLPQPAPALLLDAMLAWARAAFNYRPYPEQMERLRRAEEIARALGDKRRLAETLHALGAVQVARGHGMRAMDTLAEAFALAEELGDEELAVVPSFYAAFARFDSEPQVAVELFEKSAALARKYGRRDREAHALSGLGMALARVGRFDESRAALQAALDLTRERIPPLVEGDVYLFSGWAHLDMGDPKRGLEDGQRGVDMALAIDNVECVCGGMACVGYAHMQNGHQREAAEAFAETIQRSKISGALPMEILAEGGLALLALAEGKEDALGELEQAQARAAEIGDAHTAALFGLIAAETYLARGDPAAAEQRLGPALEFFERNDVRTHLARAQRLAAELRARQAAA